MSPSFGDLRQKIRSHLGLIPILFLWSITILGVVGVIVVIGGWYQGISVPQYFIDSGPLLLVIVTMVNIGLAGLGYIESRKERGLARQTLEIHERDIKLKEKPAIIDTIGFSIEPTRESLEEDRSQLSQEINGYNVYPELEEVHWVNKELLQDLPEMYPDLHLDIPAYLSIRRAYQGKWGHLKDQFVSQVPDELDDEHADMLLRATGSSLEEIGGKGDVFWQRIDEYSSDLAIVALTGSPPSTSKGWIEDNIDDIRNALFQLRGVEPLKGDFEELDGIREDLKHENDRISNNVKKTKDSLKDEYDIRESEIVKRVDKIEFQEDA